MRSLMIVVAYDGTDYNGFQRQPDQDTIQSRLEQAASTLVNDEVTITGAGRTDSGVHARAQVCSFKAETNIPSDRLPYAFNSLLPPDIVVLKASDVKPGFCARRSAVRKTYSYRVLTRHMPCPLRRRYVWHVADELDQKAMEQLAGRLIGRGDFKALSRTGSSATSTVRTIYELELVTDNDELIINVTANGFLYAMVRLITGTLIDVGRGRIQIADVITALTTGSRGDVGATAPPHGLTLQRVEYGEILDTC